MPLSRPKGLLFLSRGHRADLLEVARGGRQGARHRLRPGPLDGRMTVGCYIYDVEKGRELDRSGFVVGQSDWRRAAHKCSGLAYKASPARRACSTPGSPMSRKAVSGRTRPPHRDHGQRRVRSSLPDQRRSDGADPAAVAQGARRSPYVSFTSGTPQVRVLDIASGDQRPLVPGDAMSFAPRFSPDGKPDRLLDDASAPTATSMSSVPAAALPQRLTTSPGIDTDPSFSPDGSRIVFESDRSGPATLHHERRRLERAAGQLRRRRLCGARVEPRRRVDRLHLARRTGARIGIINVDGSGERMLTGGPADEGPSWAASGREIVFQRADAGGRTGLYRISLAGGEPRQIVIPQDASDPDWSGRMDLMRRLSSSLQRLRSQRGFGQLRLPHIVQARTAPACTAEPLPGIDALRADFAARSGGTTVYFGPGSAGSVRRRGRCSPRRRSGSAATPRWWCGSKAMATRRYARSRAGGRRARAPMKCAIT